MHRSLSALFIVLPSLLVLILCVVPLCSASAFPRSSISRGVTAKRAFVSPPSLASLSVRGGATSDDDEDDQYDEEEEGEAGTEVSSEGGGGGGGGDAAIVAKKVLGFLGRATVEAFKGLRRAVEAGLAGEDVDEDDEGGEETNLSVLAKTGRLISRMVRAAFSPPAAEDEEDEGQGGDVGTGGTLAKSVNKKVTNADLTSSMRKKSSKIADDVDVLAGDFGAYLAHAYGVTVDTGEGGEEEEGEDAPAAAVRGGSLGDALRSARAHARLLVVFIPSSRPATKRKVKSSASYDEIAIQGLLSQPVSAATARKARKKEEWGSFILWSAKAGSPEAATAAKRLKAKPPGKGKGGNSPILLVAYAAQVVDSSGRPKLVPRVLAQHHCSPPPTPESMAAWLNALRKRHAKQYAAMHHELREARLFKERTEGYKSSLKDDRDREEREKREEEERLAKEEAERERREALERRREELLESLPQEPDASVTNVVTIALRFSDGRKGQRRFADDVDMDVVFNWVDAMYGVERERVELSTMNGQKSFAFVGEGGERTTLKGAGLGKMTGLRVSLIKDEQGDDNKGEEAGVE